MARAYCISHSDFETRNAKPFRVCQNCNHTWNYGQNLVDSLNMLMQDLGSPRKFCIGDINQISTCPHCMEGIEELGGISA